jgi:hypothetical protein
MFYVLIAPSDDYGVLDIPANRGYNPEVVRTHLEQLAAEGHMVTSEPVADNERKNAYFAAASQAGRLGIQVSRVFGTRRHSGVDCFGKEVPALLVYDYEGGKLVDIYPHSHKHDSVAETIVGYLAAA